MAADQTPAWASEEVVETELMLLGGLLVWPEHLPEAESVLGAEDFYRPEHGDVFRALRRCRSDKVDINAQSVYVKLTEAGLTGRNGDGTDVHLGAMNKAMDHAITGANTRYYSERLAEMASRRRIALDVANMAGRFNPGTMPSEEMIESLKETIASSGSGSAPKTIGLAEAADQFLDQLKTGERYHYRSGIPELDESIEGISDGEMAVVGARPSHGKTAMAIQWCHAVAKQGFPCAYVSQEMTAAQLGQRSMLRSSTLDQRAWRPEVIDHLRAEAHSFAEGMEKIHIVDRPGTLGRVESSLRYLAVREKIKFAVLDYVQLIRMDKRPRSRYEEITEISSRLKCLAGELEIALLVLAQSGRDVDKRDGWRPRLSDLKESGQLEADADLVIFPQLLCLFDSDKFEPRDYRIYVAKRRNGPIGKTVIDTQWSQGRQTIGRFDPLPF